MPRGACRVPPQPGASDVQPARRDRVSGAPAGRPPGDPGGARTQGAVAVVVDDPQRQPPEARARRAQGRRAPGVVFVAHRDHDGALFRRAAARGPGGGEAPRGARLPRHPVSVRAREPRTAGALPQPRRRPGLPVPHQGRRRRRFLDRLGRARRGADRVLGAGPGLPRLQGADRRGSGCRADDRAGGRCRARRGQRLRGAAGELEARRAQPLVGGRLQPPEPRFGGLRPAVRAHRRVVPLGRLAGADAQIRPPARSRLRRAGRGGVESLDRRLPQLALLRAHLQGRRGLARAAGERLRRRCRGAGAAGPPRRCRPARVDDQPRRQRSRRAARYLPRHRRRPADLPDLLHHQGLRAPLRRATRTTTPG